jgi:ribosome-binding factor A
MSQRVAKVESLIQQVVAGSLPELLEADAARATVTRVDAAPDLRNATVWIGLLGDGELWDKVVELTAELQRRVAARTTMKFAPRLHLRQDTGGAYAAEIERLLREQ